MNYQNIKQDVQFETLKKDDLVAYGRSLHDVEIGRVLAQSIARVKEIFGGSSYTFQKPAAPTMGSAH